MYLAYVFLAVFVTIPVQASHWGGESPPAAADTETDARVHAKITDAKELKVVVPKLIAEYDKTETALAAYLKSVEKEPLFEKQHLDLLRGELAQIKRVKERLNAIKGKLTRGDEVALSLWTEDRDLARLDVDRFMLAFYVEYWKVRQKKVKSDDPSYAEKEGYLALMKDKAKMAALNKERLFQLKDLSSTYTNKITGKTETRPGAIRVETKDGFISVQHAFMDMYGEVQALIASGKIEKDDPEVNDEGLKENFLQHFGTLMDAIEKSEKP